MSNISQINDQPQKPLKLNIFFSQHAVFTLEELDRFLSERGSGNPNTRKSLLTYYRKQGRILPIRRGLYATVPLGADPKNHFVDPYLVTAKLTADSVLGYHTALEFYGKAYSVYTQFHYFSAHRSVPLRFRTHEFIRAPVPAFLRSTDRTMFGVNERRRDGVLIRVTSLERTLVDVLDRPELTGSWEEIWRSLESVEFFDLDQVVEYALLSKNATTAAKVGFFLEQHRETLMVDDMHLEPLRRLRPRQPHYLVRRKRRDCRWIKAWNLMVPLDVLAKSWEAML